MPLEAAPWLASAPDGAVLRVRVATGAARSGLAGLRGQALRVRVAARPVGGAANRELLRFLAGALGVRPSSLTIEAGLHAREKRVRVRGLTSEAVEGRLLAGLCVDTPPRHN